MGKKPKGQLPCPQPLPKAAFHGWGIGLSVQSRSPSDWCFSLSWPGGQLWPCVDVASGGVHPSLFESSPFNRSWHSFTRNTAKPNLVNHHLLWSLRAVPEELGVQGQVPRHLRCRKWSASKGGGMLEGVARAPPPLSLANTLWEWVHLRKGQVAV